MVNVVERIKKALFAKGWTQRKLCSEIDITENGFRRMADDNTWKLQTLAKMAEVLGVPVAYFVSEEEPEEIVSRSVDKGSFGSDVAERILEEFRELKSQLSIKDKQIDGLQRTADSLQRTVDTLLGSPGAVKREKSFRKPVAGTGRILELYPAEQQPAQKVA